jgi:hypothetical protein
VNEIRRFLLYPHPTPLVLVWQYYFVRRVSPGN